MRKPAFAVVAATIAALQCIASATPLAAQASATTRQPLQNASLAKRVAHVHTLLKSTPLVDGHNDLPWAMREFANAPLDVVAYDLTKPTKGMTDIARLRKGHIGGQFWSVYVPGEVKDSGYARIQLEQIDIMRRVMARYPKDLAPVTTAAALRAAHKSGKIGSLLGMEGGHVIENSLGALRAYYDLGARYMTLTHNVTLDWADAANDAAKHGGLTPFGKEVVREMNRLGMLVDLSHVSPGVMSHALDVSEAPVIFSHSSARALVDVPRNVPDSILQRLPKNGGVVMVAFVPQFVNATFSAYNNRANAFQDSVSRRFPGDNDAQFKAVAAWREKNPAPVSVLGDVADHLDHIKRVAGAQNVGLGADYDGITVTVQGLEDVSRYPELLAELVKRGWTDTEIRGVAGENVLRALTRAEAVSARLRATRPASTKTIQQLDRKITP
ncbi:MAG: membrane dipeptidase [Phycisphaerae bacterium]|nr:membrane dipeptidase [Gemmatimonadaceae bacterium]